MKDKYFMMTLEMWNKEVSKELPKKGSLLTSERKIRASILNGLVPFFATEAFESQNAVIRLQSVHSNRSAPSKDIAYGFSYMHAVRHLVCGGYYLGVGGQVCQAGEEVCSLLGDEQFRALIGASKLRTEGMLHFARQVVN